MPNVAEEIEYRGFTIVRLVEATTGELHSYEIRDGLAFIAGPFMFEGAAKRLIDRKFK